MSAAQIVTFDAAGVALFTIDLANAQVVNIRTSWSARAGEAVYEIELTYSRYIWTGRGGISTEDDWAPTSALAPLRRPAVPANSAFPEAPEWMHERRRA